MPLSAAWLASDLGIERECADLLRRRLRGALVALTERAGPAADVAATWAAPPWSVLTASCARKVAGTVNGYQCNDAQQVLTHATTRICLWFWRRCRARLDFSNA